MGRSLHQNVFDIMQGRYPSNFFVKNRERKQTAELGKVIPIVICMKDVKFLKYKLP